MSEIAQTPPAAAAVADARAYPSRPFVGVGVVIWKGDKVLLIQRGKPPRMGQWSIPGGGQELGETVRETAIREAKEETGLDIEVRGLIDVVDAIRADHEGKIESHITLIDYAARWVAGEPVAGDDAMGAGWFTLDEVARLGIWEETVRVIRVSREHL
jgi:ADP-ribose pyrophosphatase YjhB (NUDIX family)